MVTEVKIRDMRALARYQDELMKAPRLRYIFFEITDMCNLECLHCGSSCSSRRKQFLPVSAVERTLHSIAEECSPKDIMVCITGGEPLLHPDLDRIVSIAHSMGFPVGITTNGTLIDDARAKALWRCGLDTVAVSIDGTREIHDRFRNQEGCFDRAVRGAGFLRKYGLDPQAITVANKSNLDCLPELREFLIKEGFESWRITNMDPIGRARVNSNLLLSGEEMQELLSFIRDCRFNPDMEMEVTYGCAHYLSAEYEREVRDFYFQCGAGILIGSVMANGDIGACLDIERRPELIQGNIFQDDFMKVWKGRFAEFRSNRALQSKQCAGCEHRELCRGDSAHTWDYEQKEPLYCLRGGIGA